MRKLPFTKSLKISGAFLISGILFLGGIYHANALIYDGGVEVPGDLSDADSEIVSSLIRDIGPQATKDLFFAGTPEKAIQLAQQVGIANVTNTVQRSSGGDLGKIIF